MNVIDIVAEYLMANKYDGLCLPEHGCACLLEDLAPCAAISEKCRPGHRVNVSADTPCLCDESGTDHWHIEAKETRMMNSTQQNEVNGGTPLAERIGSGNCSMCNWTNVSLLNLGNPGTPRMVCIGCCKRAVEALDIIRAAIPNACQCSNDTATPFSYARARRMSAKNQTS